MLLVEKTRIRGTKAVPGGVSLLEGERGHRVLSPWTVVGSRLLAALNEDAVVAVAGENAKEDVADLRRPGADVRSW